MILRFKDLAVGDEFYFSQTYGYVHRKSGPRAYQDPIDGRYEYVQPKKFAAITTPVFRSSREAREAHMMKEQNPQRKHLIAAIYRDTHADYRGSLYGRVMMLGKHGGSEIVNLNTLDLSELRLLRERQVMKTGNPFHPTSKKQAYIGRAPYRHYTGKTTSADTATRGFHGVPDRMVRPSAHMTYEPIRGHGYVLLAMRMGRAVGFVDVTKLGYGSVKDWMKDHKRNPMTRKRRNSSTGYSRTELETGENFFPGTTMMHPKMGVVMGKGFPNPGAFGKRRKSGAIDHHAVRELLLYIDNDEPLYRQKMEMYKNLDRKRSKSSYSTLKSPKLFHYLVSRAAVKYAKEFGSGSPEIIFNTTARRAAAIAMARNYGTEHRYQKRLSVNPNPRKPTIYIALYQKLGRPPTNAELKAEVVRIKAEGWAIGKNRNPKPGVRAVGVMGKGFPNPDAHPAHERRLFKDVASAARFYEKGLSKKAERRKRIAAAGASHRYTKRQLAQMLRHTNPNAAADRGRKRRADCLQEGDRVLTPQGFKLITKALYHSSDLIYFEYSDGSTSPYYTPSTLLHAIMKNPKRGRKNFLPLAISQAGTTYAARQPRVKALARKVFSILAYDRSGQKLMKETFRSGIAMAEAKAKKLIGQKIRGHVIHKAILET